MGPTAKLESPAQSGDATKARNVQKELLSAALGGMPGGLTTSEKSAKLKENRKLKMQMLDALCRKLDEQAGIAMDQYGNLRDGTPCLAAIKKLHAIMDEIQKLEKAILPVAPSSHVTRTPTERLQLLTSWLKERGVQMPGLELKAGLPEGAGVVATRDFAQEDVLCTVPTDIFMTTANALRSAEDVFILVKVDPLVRQMPSIVLALHLLFEKHLPPESPSKWAGYIASLPGQSLKEQAVLLPLGFSFEALHLLEGTMMLMEVHKHLRNLSRQFYHVRTLLRNFSRFTRPLARSMSWFTLSEFRWAISVTLARQNNIPRLQDDHPQWPISLALIPLMDIFNHEGGPNTAVLEDDPPQMVLTAKRDFKKGEQVFFSYGHRPNRELFLYSGFVADDLDYDSVRIPVELPKDDPLRAKKQTLLRFMGLQPMAQYDLFVDGHPSAELHMWLRVVSLTDEATVTQWLRETIATNTEALRRQAEEEAAAAAALASAEAAAGVAGSEQNGESKMVSKGKKAGKTATGGVGGSSNGSVAPSPNGALTNGKAGEEAKASEAGKEEKSNGMTRAPVQSSSDAGKIDGEPKAEAVTSANTVTVVTSADRVGASGRDAEPKDPLQVVKEVVAQAHKEAADAGEEELIHEEDLMLPAEGRLLAQLCAKWLGRHGDKAEEGGAGQEGGATGETEGPAANGSAMNGTEPRAGMEGASTVESTQGVTMRGPALGLGFDPLSKAGKKAASMAEASARKHKEVEIVKKMREVERKVLEAGVEFGNLAASMELSEASGDEQKPEGVAEQGPPTEGGAGEVKGAQEEAGGAQPGEVKPKTKASVADLE